MEGDFEVGYLYEQKKKEKSPMIKTQAAIMSRLQATLYKTQK